MAWLAQLCPGGAPSATGFSAPVPLVPGSVRLLASPNVLVDRPAAEAGLAMLAAGGDFADGVIAFDGSRRGGDVFTSFDREAADLVASQGGQVHLLQVAPPR